MSDDDEDIEIGGVTQDFKCPITLTPLQDPMTSCAPLTYVFSRDPSFKPRSYRNVCKHSYSSAAIREYLSKGPQKCPATGCNKRITMSNLKADKALERRVKEHTRREAMRAEDEDVDAEIID